MKHKHTILQVSRGANIQDAEIKAAFGDDVKIIHVDDSPHATYCPPIIILSFAAGEV